MEVAPRSCRKLHARLALPECGSRRRRGDVLGLWARLQGQQRRPVTCRIYTGAAPGGVLEVELEPLSGGWQAQAGQQLQLHLPGGRVFGMGIVTQAPAEASIPAPPPGDS